MNIRELITKRRINTVEFKIFFMIAVIMIPLISLLNFNSFYAQHIARSQAMDSFQNVLKIYMNQVDNSFNEVDKYIYQLDQNNMSFQMMKDTRDETKYMLSEIWMHNELSNSVTRFLYIDSLFIYNPKNGHIIYGIKDVIDQSVEKKIFGYIKTTATSLPDRHAGVWKFIWIGDRSYVFRIEKLGKLYMGAWADGNNLCSYLGASSEGNSFKLIQAGTKLDSIINIAGTKYDRMDVISSTGNFGIVQYVSEKKILKQIPAVNNTIRVLSFLFILLLPVTLFAVRKIVVKPLKDLRKAMRSIENGDLNIRLNTDGLSYEFERVNATFNNMMDQIKYLKIDVYEKKVREKKIQLRNLQLQINPHFLLNTLNILYSYEQKDYPHIQRMIIYLVKYFRYMYKANQDFVTLESELTHVENYLNIQRIRYPDGFLYDVRCMEELKECSIPPMLIQNFVENSIKYGMVIGEKSELRIKIKIEKLMLGEDGFLQVVIHDSGKGFLEEALEKIRVMNKYIDKNGEHIGIWNSLMRLDMLYDGKARAEFYNAEEGGAVVKLQLPYLVY